MQKTIPNLTKKIYTGNNKKNLKVKFFYLTFRDNNDDFQLYKPEML